jgi:hypothetical protein
MLDNSKWPDVAAILSAGDFYRSDHRLIFRAIQSLAEKGSPFDVVTLADCLERSHQIEEAGGFAYLGVLVRDTPSAANVDSYARIVRERSLERGLEAAFAAKDVNAISQIEGDLAAFRSGSQEVEPFVDVTRLLSNPAAPEWLINGWVQTDSTTLIFGDPGSGKSLLAQDWACSIAAGTPWCGNEITQGITVIFAGEGNHGIARRIAAWSEAHEVAIPEEKLFVSPQPLHLDDQGLRTALRFINSLPEKPVMIQVDTLARHLIGDENSASDVGGFMRCMDALRAATGAAIIIVHHSGHSTKDRARGSTALRAAMDTEFRVEKIGDSGGALTCTKVKDAEFPPPLAYEITRVELPPVWADTKTGAITSSVIFNAQPGAVIPRAPSKLNRPQQIALEALEATIEKSGEGNRVLVGDWRKTSYEMGISTTDSISAKKKAFQRAVGDLLERNLVATENDWYWLTQGDKGDIMGTCPNVSPRVRGTETGGQRGHSPLGDVPLSPSSVSPSDFDDGVID